MREPDLAVRHQVGAVGERDGALGALLDQQHRDAALADLGERREDDVDDLRREAERRLVEQQDIGPGDERARDRELLLLAAGERTRPAPRELLDDRELRVDRLDVLAGARARAPPREAEPQVLLDRQLGEDAPPLGHERDARARDVLGRPAAQRVAGQPDLAAPSAHQSHDRVQRRRLARAVRTDQADDLAPADLEREAAHGGDAAVAHVEAGDLEHRVAHASSSCTALSPR